MNIQQQQISATGIKFYIAIENKEVARAYLYILRNDLHLLPFGLMEDVFVEESSRQLGYGTALIDKVIEEAKFRKCYKLICTSRYGKEKVHNLYLKKGFKSHGIEFRINF